MVTRKNTKVVYLLIPTSNHNCKDTKLFWFQLYIFWFLHQTTTYRHEDNNRNPLYIFWFLHQTTTITCIGESSICCISFDSYIKPQRVVGIVASPYCCISFDSYIKPQLTYSASSKANVVYLLIPTSNHNIQHDVCTIGWLYIFWFLHQTTTYVCCSSSHVRLYIFWFLHQTTTIWTHAANGTGLYIFWFLHQTTTYLRCCLCRARCISFDSYIKPQPAKVADKIQYVVYLLIPTSNHNAKRPLTVEELLYIFWFLHQTTTLLKFH